MLRLMYITNDTKIAQIVQKSDVDWIFVDLEYIGKDIRQSGRNTVISAHSVEDVRNIRKVVTTSKLMVRVNPLGEWSKKEIDDVIDAGADIIMLPFFKRSEEVEDFISLVDGRVKTCLLVETMSAVEKIDDILSIDGIDFIHIGLNDIHIERKTTFMFEFLGDGYVDILAQKIKHKKIPFGFGGFARVDSNLLPTASHIIAEHYRVGSTSAILSRSFCNIDNFDNYKDFEISFKQGVDDIRAFEKNLKNKDLKYFEENKIVTKKEIDKVVSVIRKQKNG